MSRPVPTGSPGTHIHHDVGARRVNGASGAFEQRLNPPGDVRLLVLRLEEGGDPDPFATGVLDGCGALLAALRDLLADAGTEQPNVALVVVCPEPVDRWTHAAEHATVEAVRGAMQSLTPELGARARINVFVCRAEGDEDALDAALRFVASPGGSYVAGSTFDLRVRP